MIPGATAIKLEILLPHDPGVWNVVAEMMKMAATIDGEVRQTLHRDRLAERAIETGDVVGSEPRRTNSTRPVKQ